LAAQYVESGSGFAPLATSNVAPARVSQVRF
jgi:hypothetical protein